jgi:hypothetical protein
MVACGSERTTPAAEPDKGSQTQELQCGLEPVWESADGIAVRATLTNNSDKSMRFLSWGTPWDELSDAFKILDTHTQEQIARFDPAWRVAAIAPEDAYIEVGAGNVAEVVFALSRHYSVMGRDFAVAMRQPLRLASTDGTVQFAVDCGQVEVDDRDSNTDLGLASAPLSVHEDCSAATQAKIGRVIQQAQNVTGIALRTTLAARSGSSTPALEYLNQRWFGTATPSSNAGSLSIAFERIASSGAVVRCGGDPCNGQLGVVRDFWARDDRLYLCSPLWDNAFLGMDSYSQVEVLIHEVAHYEDSPFGNIVDWSDPVCEWGDGHECYEYPNALELASSNWVGAVRNAENYAGFAVEAYMLPLLVSVIL